MDSEGKRSRNEIRCEQALDEPIILFDLLHDIKGWGRYKHGPRGIACVYHGYDDRNDQFKVKEWLTGRIYYTADGVFYPRIFPYRATPELSNKWIKEMDILSPSVPVSDSNPYPHSMPTGPRRSMRQHGPVFSGGGLRDISESEISKLTEEEDKQSTITKCIQY